MAGIQLCDICKIRPSSYELVRYEAGERQTLHVCDADYETFHMEKKENASIDSLTQEDPIYYMQEEQNSEVEEDDNDFVEIAARSRNYFEYKEFLSEDTQNALRDALGVARAFNNEEIDTEHVLEALLDNPEVARLLKTLNISPEKTQQQIDNRAVKGDSLVAEPRENLGDTDYAISENLRLVIQHAIQEIQDDEGVDTVTPVHLFVSLVEDPQGLAGKILRESGVDAEKLKLLA